MKATIAIFCPVSRTVRPVNPHTLEPMINTHDSTRRAPFRKQKRDAFTLIEMLVVIAIIALLLSLIVPATGKALNRATRTKCLNNLRQISIATVTWAAEHRGKLPNSDKIREYPHEMLNFHDIFGEKLNPRDTVMFCPGELRKARNPNTIAYNTRFFTYQYFNFNKPFLGTYQEDKPNFSFMSSYPREAALWGCLTFTKGNLTIAHEEPAVSEPVSGMNAVFLDGHGSWVPPGNLEIYVKISGNEFHWPIPGN